MKFLVNTDDIKYNTLVQIAKDMGYKKGNLYNWLEDNTQKVSFENCCGDDDPEWEITQIINDAIKEYDIEDIKQWIQNSPNDVWDQESGGDMGTLEYNLEMFCANRRYKIAEHFAKKVKEYLENENDFSWKKWDKYVDMQEESIENVRKIGFNKDNIIIELTPNGLKYTFHYEYKE